MITITTGVLKDNALYQDIVDFVLPKSGLYDAELMAYFAENNGHFAVALDDGVVVGTSLNFELPADHYMLPRLADFLTAEGITNSDCRQQRLYLWTQTTQVRTLLTDLR